MPNPDQEEMISCFADDLVSHVASFVRSKLFVAAMDEKVGKEFANWLTSVYYDHRIYAILVNSEGLDFSADIKKTEFIQDFLVEAGLGLTVYGGVSVLNDIAESYAAAMQYTFNESNSTIFGADNCKLFSDKFTLEKVFKKISNSSVTAFLIVLQSIPARLFNAMLVEAGILKPEGPKV